MDHGDCDEPLDNGEWGRARYFDFASFELPEGLGCMSFSLGEAGPGRTARGLKTRSRDSP